MYTCRTIDNFIWLTGQTQRNLWVILKHQADPKLFQRYDTVIPIIIEKKQKLLKNFNCLIDNLFSGS